MTIRSLCTLLAVLLLCGCQQEPTTDNPLLGDSTSSLTISLASTRTSLGNKVGNTYPVMWSEGDRIGVNGSVSAEAKIDASDVSRASFELDAVTNYPLHITYPYYASTSAESAKVYFASEQSYAEGTFAQGSAPMCGYVASATEAITLKHLATILQLPIKGEGVVLDRVVVTTIDNAKLAGEFAIDCTSATLTPGNEAVKSVTYLLPSGFTLSATEKRLHIALPSIATEGCTIEFIDDSGNKMVGSWIKPSLKAGVVREFAPITYKQGVSCKLSALGVEYDHFIDSAVSGIVKDSNGNPIKGVVISDGEQCVQSDEYGFYEIECDLASTKFIFASIPSGYKATSTNGIPNFYYRITSNDIENEFCVADFTFTPIAGDANRYTLLVGADPQPRAKSKGDDRVAFHSLDICEDLYLDMADTRSKISDREVYGMMLGDIVHENMALFTNYVAGIAKTGVQMFNIIGNHDHDLSATTDEEGARRFEENFGPSYYSFNIGRQHFVVLDNVIMTTIDGKLVKNEYSYGLTDKQWNWLKNDLSFVDKSTTLMVASHVPMFKKDSAEAEFQNQSAHGTDYANLLAQYSKVHAWAGHTHRSFNYNYPSTNKLKSIEVHTLARSTGEFWTNEYNAYGTPRGYTIVEVDGDNISWKFKPTTYQKAQFVGNQYSTVGTPAYTYRDWDYNAEGVAILRGSNKPLDESYQMKAWKQGDYIYVHIFMWDDKWSKAQLNGKEMTLLKRHNNFLVADPRDYAYQEMFDFYSVNSILSGYDYAYEPVYHNSIFRTSVSGSGSGTITVTDRFGNNYSTEISW